MRVSLNTIKQYLDFDLSPVDELVERIGAQLGGVEEVIDLGAKYKDVVIVKVITAEKHPNADKLTVCMVDDGQVVNDVPRDENGYVQVVCGAPNVKVGMLTAWLPPGSTVPASFDTAEPFVLSARELRGVISQGMLAAPDELAIGAGHDGILELDPTEWKPGDVEVKPGASFAAAYGLDDTIIDIENKMFTHRPDCFGQLGVAREIAGILGHKFTSPDWYLNEPEFASADGLELTVTNEAEQQAPRFMAVAVKDVTIKPSPLWLQIELMRLGSKAINNIVDVTNYIMLLTAQPTHAYDYDKLRGHKLGVRMARAGETCLLLNGKTYELTEDDIVIADGEGVVGLAGIMGGGNSEVSATTKNVVLECADFDMYAVRKTSMRHGVFTDALTRFNKGQSPLQQPRVLSLLMKSIVDTAGGEQASAVFDESADIRSNEHIKVRAEFINDRLGSGLTDSDIIKLLENVEVSVDNIEEHGAPLYVQAPFWRTDIEQPEDIVEEVGRLHGFDKLPRVLPVRSIKPAAKNQKREVAGLIRDSLSRAGANELLTYSFVHKNVLERADQDASRAYRLGNALSPDLQYYRLSVLPSLLDKVHGNVKAGYDEFTLFEIGKGHNKKHFVAEDNNLPGELEFVDAVYTNKQATGGAPYYYVRQLVTQLAKDLGFTLKFEPADPAMDYPVTAPFDLSRSAIVTSRKGEFIGMIGELKQGVLKNFKLPEHTAAMTLDLDGLMNGHLAAGNNYAPLSRFPSVTQDISLRVAATTKYEDVFWVAYKAITDAAGEGYDIKFTPLSIYQGDDANLKTITLRVTITNYDKTLADSDVAPLLDVAAAATTDQLQAERI